MTNSDNAPPQELFFRLSGSGNGPWEISRPQPTIAKLAEQGLFQGEILDIGCGIGDNTVHIAKNTKNTKVTAIDLVPTAVEVAREKAEKASANIEFHVVDMLNGQSVKENLKEHFYDVILDSAIFHAFSNDDRQRYIQNLIYLIKPNGLYIQLCFSEKEIREGGPRRMKKSEIYELFSSENGWNIESIEDSIYESKPDGPLAQGKAYLSLIRRK